MNNLYHDLGMHAGAKPELFRFADELRKKMTKPEKILWNYLRTKPHGFKFRRQHPFSFYVLDFYCHKARISIEIDGNYHLSKKQSELDEIRTEHISNFGVTELRFSNEIVNSNLSEVICVIKSKLKEINLKIK